MKTIRLLPLTLAFLVPALNADFVYKQSADITGGALKTATAIAGKFDKRARMPMDTTVVFKDGRMAQISEFEIIVTDVNAETITTIVPGKKQYSVVTFDQMRQYLEQMKAKMKKKQKGEQAQLSVSASVEHTDNERVIDNRTAKETRVKMAFQGKDPQSGSAGAMDMLLQTWGVKPDPGYEEVREFYKTYGEKLNWMPGSALAMFSQSNPGAQEGLGDMYKELAKADSMPLLQVVSMGSGDMTQPAAQTQGDQSGAPPAPEEIGKALKKGLGGFGGFGRRKKNKQPDPEPAPDQAATQPQGSAGGSKLMEMTIKFSNHSDNDVDEALVDNQPDGYKRVPSQIEKALR